MENLLKLILEMTIYSSMLIVAILIIRALWMDKINLKIISVLWIILLARLIVPITFESGIHMDRLFAEKNSVPQASEITASEDNSLTTSAAENNLHNTSGNYTAYEQPTNAMNDANIYTPANEGNTLFTSLVQMLKSISVQAYLAFIWLIGVCITYGINAYRLLKFNSKLKGNKQITTAYIDDLMAGIESKLNVKNSIKVIRCKHVDMPVTFGLFRPVILLPVGFENKVTFEKLELILTHEVYHIKRYDMLKNYLWLTAKILHWFNPLVWIAYKEYRDDIELAVDNMVIRSESKERAMLYSQSILDVLHISNGLCKAPMALTFCNDKNKIKKRIKDIVIKTEKKKSLGFVSVVFAMIMIGVCFTTACQPTPDELVVQNKNNGELEAAIAQTATPTEIAQPAATEEPKIIIQDVSSNASNTVTVDINAEVVNEQPNNIPIAFIESSPYTKEETLHMIDVFFGNTTLYSRDWIKEDYEFYILKKQYQMNDPVQLQAYADDRDITDLSYAKENIQAAIDRAKDSMKDAPDTRIAIDYDTALNSDRGLDLLVMTREGFLGNINGYNVMSAFNDDDIYYRSRSLEFCEYIEETNTNPEFLNAKQMAIQMVADMNITNVTFSDAFTSKDARSTDNGVVLTGREFYVFCFDTIIGDSVMDANMSWNTPPSLVDMSGKDGYEDVPEPQYVRVSPYDSLEVWVEGDKIVQFKNRYPVEVTEIINDNVQIAVDYMEAIELAKQFAYTAFIDPRQNALEYKLNINRIELVLIRIKEKDTLNDMIVPVWNFCGNTSLKVNPKNINEYSIVDENGWRHDETVPRLGDVLITINALDGTVINMGYNNGYEWSR